MSPVLRQHHVDGVATMQNRDVEQNAVVVAPLRAHRKTLFGNIQFGADLFPETHARHGVYHFVFRGHVAFADWRKTFEA